MWVHACLHVHDVCMCAYVQCVCGLLCACAHVETTDQTKNGNMVRRGKARLSFIWLCRNYGKSLERMPEL